jgi:hypothetical protein
VARVVVVNHSGALIDKFDEIKVSVVEPAAVVGQGPWVYDLVREEAAGQDKCKGQPPEAVGDCSGVLDGACMWGEVTEYEGGFVTWENTELQQLGVGPPVETCLPSGDDYGTQ